MNKFCNIICDTLKYCCAKYLWGGMCYGSSKRDNVKKQTKQNR